MRDECGVIIVRNQDGDILLNFGELKQTSLQRMSAWHHCNPSPAMRKSLTSRKYVKADNKGEGSNSQHSQVSNDSRLEGSLAKVGILDSQSQGFLTVQPMRGLGWWHLTNERPGWLDSWLLTWVTARSRSQRRGERMSSGTQSAISSIWPDTRQSGENIVQSVYSYADHGSTLWSFKNRLPIHDFQFLSIFKLFR